MALIHQLAGLPVPGGDLVFKNYGLTAIPAGYGVLADGTNKGDASNPPGIVLPTASGGVAKSLGITMESIPAGGSGKVRMIGCAVGVAGATLTPGDPVQISDVTAHMGEIIAAASTARSIGICLSDSLNLEQVLVFVSPTSHN